MKKNWTILLTVAVLMSCIAGAGVYDWNGSGGNGDWNDPNNWTITGSSWTWPNEEFGNEYVNQDCNEINILNGDIVTRGGLSVDGGRDGSNTAVLTLDNGSILNTGSVWIGDFAGTRGTINVYNGSLLNVSGVLKVSDGDAGGTVGMLNVIAANVTTTGHFVVTNRVEGDGYMYIGPGSTIGIGGQFYMNDAGGEGAYSEVVMDGGLVTTNANTYFNDDAGAGSEAYFTMNGGTWNSGGTVDITWNPNATSHLMINHGTMTAGTNIRLGVSAGGTGQSRVFLNGGVLQGEGLQFNATDSKIVYTGGDFRISGTAVSETDMQDLITSGKIDVTGASSYTVGTDGDYTVLSNPDDDVYATGPTPADNTDGVLLDVANDTLSWTAPEDVTSPTYKVYVATDMVADPNVDQNLIDTVTATSVTHALDYDTTYFWRVVVVDGATEHSGPIWFFKTAPASPIINAVTPTEAVVDAADDQDFTVDATGVGTLSYQWFYDPDPSAASDEVQLADGAEFTGTDTATLTVLDVQPADTGYYYCEVTNAGGTVQSANAMLVIKALIGHWPFDGNADDIAGSNNGVTTNTDYPAGVVPTGLQSIHFDSTDAADAVTISMTVYNNNSYTLSWWDMADATSGGTWESMIASGPTTGFEVLEFDYNNSTSHAGGFSSGWVGYFTAFRQQWYHHALTYDHATQTCIWYINGIAVGDVTGVSLQDFDELLYVGNCRNGSQPYFGRIDDLRLYNYALTEVEVVNLISWYNFSPVVDAGSASPVWLSGGAASIDLDGTVSDDGNPSGTLTTTWSKASGPGNVTFGDASQVDTTASFDTAGEYILVLTATDSVKDANDVVGVSVHEEGYTGLIAHFTFEDQDPNDVLGNISGATEVGSPTYGAGKFGDAIYLDPSDDNDYVVLGTADDLKFYDANDFTVAFWVKTTGWDADAAIVSNKDWDSGGNTGWAICGGSGNNGGWQWNYAGETGGRLDYDPSPTSQPIADDQWHHLCVSHDRDGLATFFYDGELVGSSNISGSTGTIDAGYPTVLGTDGAEGAVWAYYFTGAVDDLRFYERILSEDEVRVLADVPMPGDTDGNYVVNTLDLEDMAGAWLSAGPTGDFDGSGLVNLDDFAILAANWLEDTSDILSHLE